jgi:hypothetical protein
MMKQAPAATIPLRSEDVRASGHGEAHSSTGERDARAHLSFMGPLSGADRSLRAGDRQYSSASMIVITRLVAVRDQA